MSPASGANDTGTDRPGAPDGGRRCACQDTESFLPRYCMKSPMETVTT